jgi:hypothetical protein
VENPENRPRDLTGKYACEGHPSIDELASDQGTVFPAEPRDLLGDFWPEDESIEDFLAMLHESRGHHNSDRAA